jgi:hypothetical protein
MMTQRSLCGPGCIQTWITSSQRPLNAACSRDESIRRSSLHDDITQIAAQDQQGEASQRRAAPGWFCHAAYRPLAQLP